jgi:hypothetical protein
VLSTVVHVNSFINNKFDQGRGIDLQTESQLQSDVSPAPPLLRYESATDGPLGYCFNMDIPLTSSP